jgi:class 3 adenylate cyclase
MLFKKDGAESAQRAKLKLEILAERMTGDSVPHYVSPYMQWGLDTEPAAKSAYEVATGRLITQSRFVFHPTIEAFGATADGFLGDDTVIEFKCPQTVTHLGWMLTGGVPEQHRPQILAQLACTRREHAVFASYDPRIRDAHRQLYVVEWTPERAEIERVEDAVRTFLAEVDAMWDALHGGSSDDA